MRTALLLLLLVLLLPVTSWGDPHFRPAVFLDFAGTVESCEDLHWGNGVSNMLDDASGYLDVYLGMFGNDCVISNPHPFTGIYVNVSHSGFAIPDSVECLLPGGLWSGNPQDGYFFESTECVWGDGIYRDTTFVARFRYFVASSLDVDFFITDHSTHPREVLDCSEPEPQPMYYCVWQNASVGGYPVPGDDACAPSTPVEHSSWGSVKALYR